MVKPSEENITNRTGLTKCISLGIKRIPELNILNMNIPKYPQVLNTDSSSLIKKVEMKKRIEKDRVTILNCLDWRIECNLFIK